MLLDFEREAQKSTGPDRRAERLMTLDVIDANVNWIVMPASFGDLFCGLHGHVTFVCNSLRAETTPVAARAAAGDAQAFVNRRAEPRRVT